MLRWNKSCGHMTENEDIVAAQKQALSVAPQHGRNEFGKLRRSLPDMRVKAHIQRLSPIITPRPLPQTGLLCRRRQWASIKLAKQQKRTFFGFVPFRAILTRAFARGRCFVASLDVNFPLPSTTSRNKLTFPFRSKINIADADMLGGEEWENPSEEETRGRKKNYPGLRKNMGHSSELILAPIILLPSLHSFTLLSCRVRSARDHGSQSKSQASCSHVHTTSGGFVGFLKRY